MYLPIIVFFFLSDIRYLLRIALFIRLRKNSPLSIHWTLDSTPRETNVNKRCQYEGEVHTLDRYEREQRGRGFNPLLQSFLIDSRDVFSEKNQKKKNKKRNTYTRERNL